MNWIKKIFNLNTGMFVNQRLYTYNGKPHIGFELCQGFVLFGIPGYDRLYICHDKETLDETLEVFDIKPSECGNYPNK